MLGKSSSRVKPIALGATVQSSTYGQTIPVIYGRTKVAMYLIWEQNIRQGGGGKKYKKSLGKKSPPDYEANVDFLIGHNPIAGVLQCWQNQNLRFPLSFGAATGFGITGPTLTITNPNFYFVIGVTYLTNISNYTAGNNLVILPDYGSNGVSTTYLSTTQIEIPAWNESFQGPDPGAPNSLNFLPTYRWVPGSGNVIGIDGINSRWYNPFSTMTVYVATLDPSDSHDFTKHFTSDVPLTALRLTFENVLGNGPEYSGYSAQQIMYPHYAGVGSPNFDMGSTQTMPDTRIEVQGAHPVHKTGDADFVDMIADIVKQGISQAGFGAASSYSPLQRGLNCFNYPTVIQRVALFANGAGGNPVVFPVPNTAGNYIIVALQDGGGLSGYVISDTDGNTYHPFYTVSGYGLWYAVAVGNNVPNTVTVSPVGIVWNITIMEVAGVDTLDSFNTVTSTPTGSITTTNTQGNPALILAIAQYGPNTAVGDPGLAQWTDIGLDHTNFVLERTVYSPGAYSVTIQPQIGGASPARLTMVSIKSANPAIYPRPLGDILDHASMECTRAQCWANGLYGSLCMDSQQKAADWLKDLYDAANAAPVWSGFKLKTIPYSEVSILGTSPGALYYAPSSYGGAFYNAFSYLTTPRPTVAPLALSESDFIGDANTPLITVERKAQVDVPNILQVQFPNRTSDYNPIIVSQPEDGTRALYGPRKDSPRTFNCVQDPSVARTLLGIMVRKQAYLRNTYKFKLNAKWKLLEPMDLILLPQSATMPTINGVPATQGTIPVRITSVSESETYELDCEAEPYIWGTYAPTPLTITAPQPYQPAVGLPPSSINTPIIFEPVPRLSGEGNQNEIWFVISDSDPNYGGCLVLISVDDGNSYNLLGTITGNAITGYSTADWPSTVDPDTTVDLFVDLTESNGALLSYAVKDEDQFVHPCYVGNSNGGAVTQLADGSASGTTATAVFITNNTLNNAIVVIATHEALTTLGTLSVTDSNGNSYSLVTASPTVNNTGTSVFAAFNVLAGANTVTLHTTVAELLGLRIIEIAGIGSVDAFSTSSTLGLNSGLSTGTIAIASANDFQLSYIWDASNSFTFVCNSGWTAVGPVSTPSVGRFGMFEWASGQQLSNFLRDATVPVTSTGLHVGILSFKAKLPDNFAVVPYELMTYAIALLGAPFNYQMFATGGGTNHLRRSVFGAPTVGVGPDHPTGSRFAFLQPNSTTGVPGILKQRMDPIWIGKTLHFKFQAFNQSLGGLQDLSAEDSQGQLVVADYTYTPRGTYGSVNPFSQDYVESPASPLTNPTSTTIHMVQVTFTFSGNTNPAIYNARTFTIPAPTVPTLYYVTITDPGFVGDNGALTTLPSVCQTSNALVGVPGNTYIGSIVALPAGGGGGNPGGLTGGQPPPTVGHYIPDPIIAGAITPDLGLGLNHEVTLVSNTPITINNPVYNGGAVPVGIEFIIVVVQDFTGSRPTPTWGPGYTGVSGFQIGGDGLCRNTFRFVSTPAGTFARSMAPDVEIT